jgi:beta-fructofuranosidase
VLEAPLGESGCLTMLRSRDLRRWEGPMILAWPRCFERMETPQLWTRSGRWFLSFGGVLNAEWVAAHRDLLPAAVRERRSHENYCYAMDHLEGPANETELQHLEVPLSHYIMKVLAVGPGKDLALFTVTEQERGSCLSLPYDVEYAPDGKLRLKPAVAPPE